MLNATCICATCISFVPGFEPHHPRVELQQAARGQAPKHPGDKDKQDKDVIANKTRRTQKHSGLNTNTKQTFEEKITSCTRANAKTSK